LEAALRGIQLDTSQSKKQNQALIKSAVGPSSFWRSLIPQSNSDVAGDISPNLKGINAGIWSIQSRVSVSIKKETQGLQNGTNCSHNKSPTLKNSSGRSPNPPPDNRSFIPWYNRSG
jgi:hypothetical protein